VAAAAPAETVPAGVPATGTTQLVPPAAAHRHVAGTHRSTHPANHVNGAADGSPASEAVKILSRLVNVIPPFVWIVLAAALLLTAIAAVATLLAARRARKQAVALAAMRETALTDPLTGVLNRRGFIEAAERELARAERYGRPFALAYVDVRGLKAVNDSHGHRAGDELIRHAAQMLKDSARADDVVGRLGGDELAVLLAEQTSDGADALTTRIHEQMPAHRAEMALDTKWDLTIGTAAFPEDGDDLEELLRTADRRLYAQRGVALR
jgi:diguanylate cyclase (GGDEF)-like protein